MNYIDLFAGAGGLSEGFYNSGFKPIAHVEYDLAASNTLRTRIAYHFLKEEKPEIYLSYLRNEISREALWKSVPHELMESVINLPIGADHNYQIHQKIKKLQRTKEVDLIIGGPPCQAYSLVGRARSENNMEGDRRNYLYIHYAKYLERYKPKMFVFENVLGLKSAGQGKYLLNMEKLFKSKGYSIRIFTVEANKFGVLQHRKRLIILGWQSSANPKLPNLETINLSSHHTVQALFHDLPIINPGGGKDRFLNYTTKANSYLTQSKIRTSEEVLTHHISRPITDQDKAIYKIAIEKWNANKERLSYADLPKVLKTHKNQTSFTDRFKVVANNLQYSQTVVAHISKDGHYYIHPDEKQLRSISIREAARLQSFPDNYYFEGVKPNQNRTAALKQIGNAVPPLMAQTIASLIATTL